MNMENIKGPLLLSPSGWYIFKFLFQNTLAAILLQGAREERVYSCNITSSLGKTQFLHTQTGLAASDCTEPAKLGFLLISCLLWLFTQFQF